MKIIQVPFCFLPDPIGGTEVYVANLARHLLRAGVEVLVAAPGETNCAYTIENLRVRRFATNKVLGDVAELYGEGDRIAAEAFAQIIDAESPDIVHLHAFTAAVSLRLMRACKSRGIPVIFTYHTPTVSCQRGTLMLWGEERCDGELQQVRCTACSLQGLGLDRRLAMMMSLLPPALGRALGNIGAQGSIWTASRMTELMRMRQSTFHEMMSEVDHVVAVCEWVQDVLRVNGIPHEKISVSRQGIDCDPSQASASIPAAVGNPYREVRLAFVGRIDPTKGLHILFDALRRAPTLRITLDVYGIVQSEANSAYLDHLLGLAKDDRRIAFHDPVPSSEVVACLRQFDFLIVPSQWMETGPLVVLEAFAAGIPVIGSDLGGTAELVQHGVNGLLVEPHRLADWVEALRRISEDPELRVALTAGVRPPKSSAEVSAEMLGLYGSHLNHDREAIAVLN